MLFTIISTILLIFLLVRTFKNNSFSERIDASLFFILYLYLTLSNLTQLDPSWLRLSGFLICTAGLFWFWGRSAGKIFQNYRDSRNRLREFKKQKGPLHEIIAAAQLFSHAKLGALIAIERRQPLDAWQMKAVPVDARLSREILFSIFTPPGALHDGATLVKNDRVICSGLIVPLTKNPNLSKELGTRHRAALGFSEVTDALCLVISEETGMASLADRGVLYYAIPFEKLALCLERALRFKLNKNKFLSFVPEETCKV